MGGATLGPSAVVCADSGGSTRPEVVLRSELRRQQGALKGLNISADITKFQAYADYGIQQ